MKKIILIAIVAFFSINISAQNTPIMDSIMHENFKAEKRSVVEQALKLTKEEGAEFWPIYDEYNEKVFEQEKVLIDLVKENADKFDSLSDDESEKIWKKKMDNDIKIVKLEKKYYKKVLRVLPGAKTLRYFQLENKIKSISRAQLAIDIPLFNNKETEKE